MNKVIIHFFALSLYGLPVFAQESELKLSLRSVLIKIEQQFGLTFSYADENIEGIKIDPPSEGSSIDAVIDHLQSSTGLQFKKINDTFYSIINPLQEKLDVCGFLINPESEAGIIGATIQSTSTSAISNEYGYFEFHGITPEDTLFIRSLGYENLKVAVSTLAHDSCADIYMKQKVARLQEVIISNFITKGINVNTDGSFNIDAQTLGILPGLTDPDVLHTIQALPGIQSINETVSDINTRGGTNDQNLIYWEGIKMYKTGHFFGLISAFNPYLTEDVALIKNGTTAALSDGVSSTIDIQTDNQVSNAFSGGAGINMLNADLFFKIPIASKVSLQLSGRHSIADVIQTPTYDQYFDRVFRNTDVINSSNKSLDSLLGSSENFNFYDVSAKLLYDISSRDKLRINFLKLFNTINYEENEMIGNELESRTSSLDQGSLSSGLSYFRNWSDQVATNFQFYYTDYELGATNFDVLNDQRLIQENSVVETGLKLDARIALSNNFDLNTGYQFFETGVSNLVDINNPIFRELIKEVLRSHALFAEGNYTSTSGRTNLRFGLRGNYFEKYQSFILEPRFAMTQRIHENFYVELLGEMKSQTTTQVIDLQNDFLGVEKRRWILANEEDIPIVKSKQISIGFRYQPGDLLISLEGYLKGVGNITSSSQGFQNQFQYQRETGSYEVAGIDFLINQSLGNFNIWLSYSYASNTYDFPKFSPSVFPNNLDIPHTVTAGGSYQSNNFQVSAGVNWRTGKPLTLPADVIDGEIFYESPNSSRLEDYLRLDVSAKYFFQISAGVRGEFGASIWNLLDTRNIVNTYYQVDANDNLEVIQQSALGITPNFMFRVSF